MKTIIAGSRTLTNKEFILSLINNIVKENNLIVTEVISGTAKGVDTIGEIWAIQNDIPIKHFTPEWGLFGKNDF